MPKFIDIPKNTPYDISRLIKHLTNVIGKESSLILQSCYQSTISRQFNDFKAITGITDEDIKEFFKQLAPAKRFKIISDQQTLFLMMCIGYFTNIKKYEIAKLFYVVLAIKFHGSLSFHYLKFCKPEIWDLALENLSQKHIYKVKNGIFNSILYFANEDYTRFRPWLSKINISDDELIRVVYSLRTRLEQSWRSFMNKYYEIEAVKSKVMDMEKQGDKEEGISNIELISEKISDLMCTYSDIDLKVLKLSITNSGIRMETGVETIENVSQQQYKDKIKFLIVLIDRVYPLKKLCKETLRKNLIRKLISGAKVGKYSIKKETEDLLYSLNNGYSLKTINKNQVLMFFYNYLTLYIQKQYCS